MMMDRQHSDASSRMSQVHHHYAKEHDPEPLP